ncbi:Alpha/Beta hydrolase protein [Rostrohypoxylon terebratum]|nr:Alpha/Beta hydrolase protein [Rostrohypoxylon terebratum]
MAQTSDRPLSSRTLWRQFYQAYRLVLRLVRLPVWTVLSVLPYTRPCRNWTFKQSLTLYICHDIVDTEARVGLTEELTFNPGKDGDRFHTIDPFNSEFYRGPLLPSSVHPTKIGGVWFPTTPAAIDKNGTYVLWIHGGAFVTGNGRSDTCRRPANYLLSNAGVDAVFSVQYRLSGYGDIVTAYLYLTRTLNISLNSLVIAGNSSGANLVIAFVRYAEQVMPQIGRPLCAVAVSPWVAPLETAIPDYTRTKDYSAEYVAESFHQWGSRTYQPPGGLNEPDVPYVTLLGHPFFTSVPILVTFGECEALSADITTWAEEAQGIRGNSVEIYCDLNGIHASLFVGEMMGWELSARHISSVIGDFIHSRLDSSGTTAVYPNVRQE